MLQSPTRSNSGPTQPNATPLNKRVSAESDVKLLVKTQIEASAAPPQVHAAATWNTFRWIPASVFTVNAHWNGTRQSRPKGNWDCEFSGCGTTDITGPACPTCCLPRSGFTATYACRGRQCRAVGRMPEFATVEDLLEHLEKGENFIHVQCPVVDCSDRVWIQRFEDHRCESHPLRPKSNRRHEVRRDTPDRRKDRPDGAVLNDEDFPKLK